MLAGRGLRLMCSNFNHSSECPAGSRSVRGRLWSGSWSCPKVAWTVSEWPSDLYLWVEYQTPIYEHACMILYSSFFLSALTVSIYMCVCESLSHTVYRVTGIMSGNDNRFFSGPFLWSTLCLLWFWFEMMFKAPQWRSECPLNTVPSSPYWGPQLGEWAWL